jgi:hypothetical protein
MNHVSGQTDHRYSFSEVEVNPFTMERRRVTTKSAKLREDQGVERTAPNTHEADLTIFPTL